MSEIIEFYTGKNVFLTGVTGFIGKVILEKILSDIPGIDTIYILLRPKAGKLIKDRVEKLLEKPIFNKLKSQNPERFEKIHVIAGDMKSETLNISDKDRKELIERCHIILHNAADVRFDRSFHDILDTNTFGSEYILALAKEMKQLQSFVYCSTAFSQHYKILMEEKFYEPPIDPFIMKKIISKFDEHTVNILTKKILGKHPNTYAFSKCLSEHMFRKYEGLFPLAVARPSIVSVAAKEPLQGWTEGRNGLNGFILAGGRGLIKTLRCCDNYPRCIIPVDISGNAIIAIGWFIGKTRPDNIIVYNLTENEKDAVSWRRSLEIGLRECENLPLDYSILPVGGTFKTNIVHHKLEELIYHYIPAILIDILLILFMRKPIMFRIQQKVKYGLQLIEYYLVNKFIFVTDNFYNLKNHMTDVDNEKFTTNIKLCTNDDYLRTIVLGVKLYLAKESMDNLPYAKRNQKILRFIALVIKGVLIYIIGIYLWNRKYILTDYLHKNTL